MFGFSERIAILVFFIYFYICKEPYALKIRSSPTTIKLSKNYILIVYVLL